MNDNVKEYNHRFRSWLWTFLEEDSPIGDLARDAKRDIEWQGRSAVSLENRLNQMSADYIVKQTAKEAKEVFQQPKKNHASQNRRSIKQRLYRLHSSLQQWRRCAISGHGIMRVLSGATGLYPPIGVYRE